GSKVGRPSLKTSTGLRCEIVCMGYDSSNPSIVKAPVLRNRCDPMNLFALVPALGLKLEPELTRLDRLLDDDRLFQTVRANLVHHYPPTAPRRRYSTPVEVILRMLVVKRLYRWSYAATERFVGDSLVVRQLCRLYLERAPDDTTLIR